MVSRGLGALQRRLLAAFEAEEPPILSAQTLAGRELERQLDELGLQAVDARSLQEVTRRYRTIDVCVRRALRGLARRGLLVSLGRTCHGGERWSAVMYATPRMAEEFMEMGKEAERVLERHRLPS
jgi:hypothetical protein